ncbi:MAG TPA: ABC transporter permease [Chitinophagales bacterium]|nr:ABC transporter permease [Chitinophagales bacterium]
MNKLRTFLTLLGISIGIFCVIAIFSSVDSLQNNLQTGISKLGNNIIYIQKFPWGLEEGETEYPLWKYWNRPYTTYDEMKKVQERVSSAEAVAISIWMNGPIVKYGDRTVKNATINGVSQDFDRVLALNIESGRYFTSQENNSGAHVVIVGRDVVNELFPGTVDPVSRQIQFMGDALTVIGVFAKEGKSLLQTSNDNVVMMPYHYLTSKIKINGFDVEPAIMVAAKADVSNTELKDDLRSTLRAVRRIPPKREDNFALNQISIINEQINSIFSVFDIIAIFIGGFAILVGGFGIANIMFVSVRERTNLIGIKKALGAKNYFIMLEFLIEAVILSVIGGIIGLLLVFLVLKALTSAISFSLVLNLKNIFWGIVTSSAIGLIAGIVPAIIAARMNPVKAIRFK